MNNPTGGHLAAASETVITDRDSLRAIIGDPHSTVLDKDIGRIDAHVCAFIACAPLALLATSGADGSCDVSPRGERPGGFHVLDEHTLALPERPGNRRADSLVNIIDHPQVGLLFCVPGREEVVRVNGHAELVAAAPFLADMAVNGRMPKLAIRVYAREVFFHCAKALRRSSLWHPHAWPDASGLASLGRVLKDQLRVDETADRIDAGLRHDAETNLY
ncbi:MSMEG_1061 family FMN-dependent PPOX-type flavoprotein [Salinactinospora qingdaonensis]|uniref:Pyridoxamine 5'-phosphate oxidase family protein n=1 Tax=Salinactinospora qingdaonensis TaxID=702744 RepID=A0ABP7FQX8_9ACTN